ncbi:MAG: class I SAM-dependent methyltransferase [Salinisphaera sp.]|nr:class I SAM-dependent methyltransferase [Salinisphaera sp.]MDN5938027.1 class I SAM-dependent methyltransferase [Salinisphaera sp.]
MDHIAVTTAYRRMAKSYDRVFGPIFEPGRRLALQKMACVNGDRVLEVGVGTGLSLPQYPVGVDVTGIDLSEDMLERARCRLNGTANRVRLEQMDAQDLTFPDDSFDKVVAMYVASVVPDPTKMIAEMKRVCRPGGDLFIVNHFSRDHGVIALLERLLAPLSRLVGFRPSFPLTGFLDQASMDVREVVPVNLFGYWKLIRATNA